MPVIVGAARSGTTLLRLMLDAHPQLAIPPETHFLPDLRALQQRPDLKGKENSDARREAFLAAVTASPFWKDFGLDAEDVARGRHAAEEDVSSRGRRTRVSTNSTPAPAAKRAGATRRRPTSGD